MRTLISMVLGLTMIIPLSADGVNNKELINKVSGAVALLYSQDSGGSLDMRCTTTAFEKHGDKYRFVSAAHCVGDDDMQHERSAKAEDTPFFITFDEKEKVFYPAEVVGVGYQHRGDDFFVVEVTSKQKWSTVELGDEKKSEAGSAIVNVASPLGLGKQIFQGTISMLELDRPILQGDINWKGSMLLAIEVGPGSSGSAVVSVEQEAIVGFLVGTIGGTNVVAIPVSKFKKFYEAVKDEKYKYYVVDKDR